jgi:hypothetical protein
MCLQPLLTAAGAPHTQHTPTSLIKALQQHKTDTDLDAGSAVQSMPTIVV